MSYKVIRPSDWAAFSMQAVPVGGFNWDGFGRPFLFGGRMDYNNLRMAVIRSTSGTYIADCFRRAFNVPIDMQSPNNARRMRKRMRQSRYDGAMELMRQRIGALDRA